MIAACPAATLKVPLSSGGLARGPFKVKLRVGFVPKSKKWGDPRGYLLPDATWPAERPKVCRSLDLPATPGPFSQWTLLLPLRHSASPRLRPLKRPVRI